MLELPNEAAREVPTANNTQRVKRAGFHRYAMAAIAAVVLGVLGCSSPELKPEPQAGSKIVDKTDQRSGDSAATDSDRQDLPSEFAPRELVTTGADDAPKISLSVMGRYRDPMFGAFGLPAIGRDGKAVAYAFESEDGGRGNPNLRLVIRRVLDSRILHDLVILDANKPWKPEDELVVRGRVDAANQRLDKTVWSELEPLSDQSSIAAQGDVEAVTFANETTSAMIRNGKVHIIRDRRSVADPVVAKMIATNSECSGIARLADVRVGPLVALVRFQFETSGCVRDSEVHLIRLSP